MELPIPTPCFAVLILGASFFLFASLTTQEAAAAPLFREYIGAEFKGVKFSDVPINPSLNFHFILSFAIDYDTSASPSPTNGKFNIFWDNVNLSPSQVSSIKSKNSNVKVALSLGGDSVRDGSAYFNPSSVDSWVSNAVSSLTSIIKKYHLDGIDIDYEHFKADPGVFAECIGRLIKTLKSNGVISFASIAPFDNDQVQSRYLALWKSYGQLIDYVNFQFYAYDKVLLHRIFIDPFVPVPERYQPVTPGAGEGSNCFASSLLITPTEGLNLCSLAAYLLTWYHCHWYISPFPPSLVKIESDLKKSADEISRISILVTTKNVLLNHNLISHLHVLQWNITSMCLSAVFTLEVSCCMERKTSPSDSLKRSTPPTIVSDPSPKPPSELWWMKFISLHGKTPIISEYNVWSNLGSIENIVPSSLWLNHGHLTCRKEKSNSSKRLKSQQKLHGIFVWSADDSKANGFSHEKQAQELLASPN